MANEDHLRILRQGVDVWNQWREEHPRERPDLSGVEVVNLNSDAVLLPVPDMLLYKR